MLMSEMTELTPELLNTRVSHDAVVVTYKIHNPLLDSSMEVVIGVTGDGRLCLIGETYHVLGSPNPRRQEFDFSLLVDDARRVVLEGLGDVYEELSDNFKCALARELLV